MLAQVQKKIEEVGKMISIAVQISSRRTRQEIVRSKKTFFRNSQMQLLHHTLVVFDSVSVPCV